MAKDAYLEGVDKNSLENQLRDLKRRVKALELKKVKVNSLDELTTDQGLLLKGEFRAGNEVEPGSGFTGGRFGYPGFVYDGVVYFFVGVNDDVLAFGVELSTGKVVFGNKNGWLNENGLKIVVNNTATKDAIKAIEFMDLNEAGAYVAQYGIYSGDWGHVGTAYGLKITTPGGTIELDVTDEGVSISGSRVLTEDDFADMGNTVYGNNGIGISTALNMGDVGMVRGGFQTLTDDTLLSFTPFAAKGMLCVYNTYANENAIVIFDTGGPSINAVVLGSGAAKDNIALVTGPGATPEYGTDGKLNITCYSDGKIYIKNRCGGSRGVRWNLFG